jgi:hypothetical protein
MFAWWKTARSGSSSRLPSKGSDGTLNSTLPPKPSAEVHRSSELRPKTVHKKNQRLDILGTTEVATEPTAAPATNHASAEESVEEVISRLLELSWNWVFPKPLPTTQNFNQDVVRVWSARAPPARRQPTAREHAIELFQLLQRQPRLVGKWILATDLEHEVYPNLLACLGWAPRPWVGRNGVAKHLGELTVRSYKRVEVAGSTCNWAAFLVPPAGRETSGHTGLRPTSRRAHAKGSIAPESFIAAQIRS